MLETAAYIRKLQKQMSIMRAALSAEGLIQFKAACLAEGLDDDDD